MRGVAMAAVAGLAILWGCDGSTGSDGGVAVDAGSDLDAGARDAGGGSDAGVDAGGGPLDAGFDASLPDAGGPLDFEVHVVVRSPDTQAYVPADGVFVRVDGADGSTVEGATDSAGSVTLSLEPGSAPWTVTAAAAQHTATSVIGVTGPLPGALHLSRPMAMPAPPRSVTGTLFGRSGMGEGVFFLGPGVSGGALTDDAFEVFVADEPSSLRMLVVEWGMPLDGPPNNAVWLDLDRSLADLSATDITFPAPARAVVDTTYRITVPTSGALDASAFLPTTPSVGAVRFEAGFAYTVGRSGAVPDGAGGFDVTVQAFDGDMAPTHVGWTFDDVDRDAQVIATAPVVAGSTFDVPAAERIDAAGATVGALMLSWDAAAYAHIGASLTPAGGGTGWFIYSYGPAATELTAPWPELPSGVAFADLGLGPSSIGRINTFVITYEAGVGPWEWSRLREARAIVTSRDVELTGR